MNRHHHFFSAFVLPVMLTCTILSGCASYVATCSLNDLAGNSKTVAIIQQSDRILFEPADTCTEGIIFYPGGKVDYAAYAPLMIALAEHGVYGVLCHMPADYAFMGINKANSTIKTNPQVQWYIAGHSLGGAMAASYAAAHADTLSGLIMLAAYSVKDLTNSGLKVLSVYGDRDGVLNMPKMESCAGNLPDDAVTVVIPGGNHAQFGCYGAQDGDNTATISAGQQLQSTVEAIMQLLVKQPEY